DDPSHAALFGPGSLAEVPLSAVVDGAVVAGIVDRLRVSDDAVTVIGGGKKVSESVTVTNVGDN
ncbi:MAG TPA: hypothetical protein PLY19_05635, partial [Rhodoglobus sp.]|nr:hypothetical protein [Rhodoglobus sp.]